MELCFFESYLLPDKSPLRPDSDILGPGVCYTLTTKQKTKL